MWTPAIANFVALLAPPCLLDLSSLWFLSALQSLYFLHANDSAIWNILLPIYFLRAYDSAIFCSRFTSCARRAYDSAIWIILHLVYFLRADDSAIWIILQSIYFLRAYDPELWICMLSSFIMRVFNVALSLPLLTGYDFSHRAECCSCSLLFTVYCYSPVRAIWTATASYIDFIWDWNTYRYRQYIHQVHKACRDAYRYVQDEACCICM